jgi:hypothetical protein
MTSSTTRSSLRLHLLAATLLQLSHAQVGTITQDVFSLSVYSLQKPCAQSCFVMTPLADCNDDELGMAIGCVSRGCIGNGWQATNDCYCRSDLQQAAQSYLTSCISVGCSVGDYKIDAASAGSIYAQYCAENGYSPATGPAAVQATTTTPGAFVGTVGGGVGGGPTASSTSILQGSSSGSGTPSVNTVLGIVVGVVVGLLILAAALWALIRCSPCGRRPSGQNYQQSPSTHSTRARPVYPEDPPIYTWMPEPDGSVAPNDSISNYSSTPGPTQMSVSDASHHLPRRW